MQRIAVFASGRGSNFTALLEARKAGVFPGEIVLLLSDKKDAGALDTARHQGVETFVLDSPRAKGRLSLEEERAFAEACREAHADWVCLAGFMRILRGPLLEAFEGRILNIHPALLPAFPGLEGPKQAFDYGARVAGCTVHFVDAGVDTGPIVLQRAVPVLDGDDAAELAARILVEEHRIYAEALRRLLTERWERRGRRVVFIPSEEKPS